MNKFDLISIGDASWDVFVMPTESETLCQLNDKQAMICFNYGDKIPVDEMAFSVGGNAANNAVGVRRLGVKSTAILTLGDDDIGNQIIEKLIKENVDTSMVYRQRDSVSNYSTVIVVRGERTIFSYKPEKRIYNFPEVLPDTEWIYLTSLGDSFNDVYKKVVSYIKANPQVKLAFNPGSRQVRAGADVIKSILEISYMIYINREEAQMLTGMQSSDGREKELLEKTIQLGPKIAIVTDGVGGSYLFDGSKYLHASVMPIDSYERTGAGDSFGSGMLSGLIQGKSMEESLLWGTVNSASVIGYAGAQRGLLNQDQLVEWLGRAKSSGVNVASL